MNIDFKEGDIIKYKGKSINSITKYSKYIIFKKEKHIPWSEQYVVYFLDDKGRQKTIVLNDNLWRPKFVYVSNVRKEKLKKINENRN